MDTEPAPPLLPAAMHAEFGYGIYSARYGNLYTAAQLNQLFDRAFGTFSPADDIWETGGRWYDAFRPNIEKNGFETREEVLVARDAHYAAVRLVAWPISRSYSECSRAGQAFPACGRQDCLLARLFARFWRPTWRTSLARAA